MPAAPLWHNRGFSALPDRMPHIASHRWGQPACRAPRALRPWLTHTGSLTARLIAHFPRFRVRLLRQRWGQPNRDELRALGLRRSERAVIREVVLMSGDTPLVFAHSVMPRRALFHGFGRLRRQGTRSLGATLFADPRIRRSRLAYRRVDKRHPLHPRAAVAVGALPPRLWARRSRFELGRSRILVTEVFLPAVTESTP
ncbi:chorismate--pyruvate lyase family protein [Chitinimonas koreensis]|uniref:chorismate--pyruvate lyase family protein n=1 Tax=Chitinimonas koreensis TaxID=356302 RepID=UPI0003FCE679|nr:chorismate lyase [Chitinimonas koreensis]